MRTVPGTDLRVHSLCLGGNVFGWTADEERSRAVLDRYVEAGGNFIDTADMYSAWAPGHEGGESEAVIGRWMADRGNRDQLVLATKVGKKPGLEGLAPATIARAVDESLQRLGTDRVDLYYAHADDPETPLDEALAALGEVVTAGKARYLAASNYEAPRLREALRIQQRDDLPRFVALQPHYNLMSRGYEGALRPLVADEGLAVFPYFGLANGFLTGKYRRGGQTPDSARSDQGQKLLADPRGPRMLEALDQVAADHRSSLAAVSLAWLGGKETVTAPIASARTVAQLEELLELAELQLSREEMARLDTV